MKHTCQTTSSRWTLIKDLGTRFTGTMNGKYKKKSRYGLYRCLCGVEKEVLTNNITMGKSLSCGCLKKEQMSEMFKKHGDSDSVEHLTWLRIKNRCYNKNCKDYSDYGGRGVRVSDAWINDYSQFLRDMGRRPSGRYSIEREDVNGDYEAGNCRWANDYDQARNRRDSVKIEAYGVCLTVAEWAIVMEIKPSTIYGRINRMGLSGYDALFYKKFKKRKK